MIDPYQYLNPEDRKILEDGLDLLAAREYGKALTCFDGLLAREVSPYDMMYSRALALFQLKRHAEACRSLRQELINYPFNHPAREVYLQVFRLAMPDWKNEISPSDYNVTSSPFCSVSIVLPVSQADASFSDALNSLLCQSYPLLELVVVDFSAAGSVKNSVSPENPQVRYETSPPQAGFYGALQKGIGVSRGEVLGWLRPGARAHQSSLFALAEIFSTNLEIDFITGKRIGFTGFGMHHELLFELQRWSRKLLLMTEMTEDPPLILLPEATFFKRSLWLRSGAGFNPVLGHAADFDLWLRMTRHTRLYTVDGCFGGPFVKDKETRSPEYSPAYLEECRGIIERENGLQISPAHHNDFPGLVRLSAYQLKMNETSRALEESIVRPAQTRQVYYEKEPDGAFPKISIVTPSYNQGEFLEECIDSILSQGWPNLEYVIIDGGSNDNSVEIIKKYSRYLSYWQSEPDGGQYRALNIGFARTSGEIMTWLNADDKFHPGAFYSVALAFHQNPHVSWITGRPTAYNQDGSMRWVYPEEPCYSREKFINRKYDDPWVQQESTMWRRSLWEKAGACVSTEFKLAADTELWGRFFRFAQLYFLDTYIGGYRLHSDNRAVLYMHNYIVEANKIADREKMLYETAQFPGLMPSPTKIQLKESRAV